MINYADLGLTFENATVNLIAISVSVLPAIALLIVSIIKLRNNLKAVKVQTMSLILPALGIVSSFILGYFLYWFIFSSR